MTDIDGRLIIGSSRVETDSRKDSLNPATLETVGRYCLASGELNRRAAEAARNAFPAWKTVPSNEKKRLLLAAKFLLLERKDRIAALIAEEKGSPLTESLAVEVLGALEALDYYARVAPRSLRPKKSGHHVALFSHKKSAFHFSPLGPTLIISPWNFPFLIPICDILGALTGGNTVVLRPSSTTALIGLAIGELFLDAGFPPGVVNVVNCPIPEAEDMITDRIFQTVMFTGSVPVGKRIMELCSRNLTNLTLELGGKDPMIVCEDADLDRAAQGAVWGAFTNCGQSCASVERVYVHEAVYEAFLRKVVDITRSLRVGDPQSDTVDIGPMASDGQRKLVLDHIREAEKKGAVIECGGGDGGHSTGYYLMPTVLTGVDHSMKVMTEETFGPVLPIMPFSDDTEAVALANNSDYGLTASVWTRNRSRASRLAAEIEAGSVTINDHMYSFAEPRAIWGGVKQTGIGRSHGPFGLLYLVNIKYISRDFSRMKRQLWWFPYSPFFRHLLNKALFLFHHNRVLQRLRVLMQLFPHLPRITRESPLGNYLKNIPRILKK